MGVGDGGLFPIGNLHEVEPPGCLEVAPGGARAGRFSGAGANAIKSFLALARPQTCQASFAGAESAGAPFNRSGALS